MSELQAAEQIAHRRTGVHQCQLWVLTLEGQQQLQPGAVDFGDGGQTQGAEIRLLQQQLAQLGSPFNGERATQIQGRYRFWML